MVRHVISAMVLVTTVFLPLPNGFTPSPTLTVAVTPTIIVWPGTTVGITLELLAPVKNVIPIDASLRLVDDRLTDHTFMLSLGCQHLCLSAAGGAIATASDVMVRDLPTETFTPRGSAHTMAIDERATCLGVLLRVQKQFDLSSPTVIAANPGLGPYVTRPGRYRVRVRLYARLRHGRYAGLVQVRPLVRVDRSVEACTLPLTSGR